MPRRMPNSTFFYMICIYVIYNATLILVCENCARQQGEFGHFQFRHNKVCIRLPESGENRQTVQQAGFAEGAKSRKTR
jgi:hypothetical protein